jgi:hypothetical protein
MHLNDYESVSLASQFAPLQTFNGHDPDYDHEHLVVL